MNQQAVEDMIAAASAALRNIPRAEEEFTVGAACLSKDGRVFTGINVYHFTGGPCAEPVAIGTAATSGVLPPDLTLMVAVRRSRHNDKSLVINPCGRCRQQMLDLSPDISVVVIDSDASLKVVGIKELLPFSYVVNSQHQIEVAEG